MFRGVPRTQGVIIHPPTVSPGPARRPLTTGVRLQQRAVVLTIVQVLQAGAAVPTPVPAVVLRVGAAVHTADPAVVLRAGAAVLTAAQVAHPAGVVVLTVAQAAHPAGAVVHLAGLVAQAHRAAVHQVRPVHPVRDAKLSIESDPQVIRLLTRKIDLP